MRDKRVELRADFQQYYNLNLDDMGQRYTIWHAADCAAMLPLTSRVAVSINPDNALTLSDRLQANTEYWTHLAAWMNTKDGSKNKNQPKHLLVDERSQRLKEAVALDQDTYKSILARPRKGSNGINKSG